MLDVDQYKTLEGTFIRLEKLKPEDAALVYEWRISESGAFMNQPEGYSLASQQHWMQNRPASEINYMIICKSSGNKVGMIAIVNISDQDKNAEVGRLLLAPVYLKKSNPYGLEALKLCCNLVLNEWHFNKINGNV